LSENFTALRTLLETVGHFEPPPPDPIWADPRPDLAADHARWMVLLRDAYQMDGADPDGVFGVLHGIRCCGATIVPGSRGPGWKLEPGEIPASEWETIRQSYLLPHLPQIRKLLARPVNTAG
jgi:hypothetical protein